MEQLVMPTGQMRFKCREKMFELPKEIKIENSKDEWYEYLKEKFGDTFEERKLFVMKAESWGFRNVLGEKQFIII
jgi:hypothetical protein